MRHISEFYNVPGLEEKVNQILSEDLKPISIKLMPGRSKYNRDIAGNKVQLDGFVFIYNDPFNNKVFFHKRRRDKVWAEAPAGTNVSDIPFTYKLTEYLQVMCGNGYCDHYIVGSALENLDFSEPDHETGLDDDVDTFKITVFDIPDSIVAEISTYLSDRSIPFHVNDFEI